MITFLVWKTRNHTDSMKNNRQLKFQKKGCMVYINVYNRQTITVKSKIW